MSISGGFGDQDHFFKFSRSLFRSRGNTFKNQAATFLLQVAF